MRKLILTNIILITAFITSCSKKATYEKLDDGVLIHLQPTAQQSAKLLKLTVFSDKIIHVEASATDSISQQKSLSVIAGSNKDTKWNLTEQNGTLTLSTSLIKASVSLATGALVFTDSSGNVMLRENNDGGKTFTRTQVDGLNSYVVRQVFESPADEAFYGLGGYQNGQLNLKGEDVDLTQHNIIDVIPFLYSSKNYGILWDNYSISKFGDPRDYQSLSSSLKLVSKDGKEGGLTTEYYVDGKIVKSVVEDKIDYEFLETPQVDSFPKDVAQRGKVVWEGSFITNTDGDHKFLVYASGYFKVWVDNKLIFDKWRQGWNPASNKFKIESKKDEKHSLKIEWIPDGGAYIAVRHLDPIPDVEQNNLSLLSEVGDAINYYFVAGENADDVIGGYRALTGKATIVPKWAMGFWQSRERYKTQKEILDVVKEYRKRNIPLDNIVLDWQYWEESKWGSHKFDPARFPDPAGMINELHDKLHTNLMISVWPKFYKGTDNYEAMNKEGYLFKNNIEKKRKDWVGPGYESTFYDPFNPKASAMFWKQIDENLNKIDIDAWWLDATEPDMHSNISVEERKVNMSPTYLGPGAKYFNAYSLMNSKGVYEGQRNASPDKRVFILTRSAFAGQQRYGAATWSGDIVSRWSDMQDQIATGINFSLAGIPYWTMDIGGFAVERRYEHATGETLNEWRELNTRWFQFGAFCPLFRSHGQFPLREIFNIAPENSVNYKSLVYYDKMRYRLMPYIYSLAGQSYFDDYTIMRGLVMDFNSDSNVRNIADQYMFGPSLLVNPVYTYKALTREVYLPQTDGWYDFYTGKYVNGGQKIVVDAPVDKIPLFVKEGSIIPTGPSIQYATEKSDPITLYVFTGKDGAFTLYEDENVNYNYEKESYSNIPFVYNEQSKTLTIGSRKGSFPGMVAERTFEIVWVTKDHSVGIDFTAHADATVKYSGQAVSVSIISK